MKYFFISDVHGYYDKFTKKIKEEGYDENNPDHKLCVAGDFVDGGPNQIKTLRYLRRLLQENKAIIVRGNHEDLHVDRPDFYDEGMEKEMIELFEEDSRDIPFHVFRDEIIQEFKDFIIPLPYFIENDHFVMVHAGIDPTLPDWREGPKGGVMWTDSMTWMEHENRQRIFDGAFKNFGKKVITGHTWVENHHYYNKNGHPPYPGKDVDHSMNNTLFEVDDYICVDAKWHEAESKGLVYIMEVPNA